MYAQSTRRLFTATTDIRYYIFITCRYWKGNCACQDQAASSQAGFIMRILLISNSSYGCAEYTPPVYDPPPPPTHTHTDSLMLFFIPKTKILQKVAHSQTALVMRIDF